jgi:LysR family transcriptional regulator, glycine cleavage system transcriptional activator
VLDDVAAGTVSAPLDDGYTDSSGYHLVYPENKAHLPPLLAFKIWLLAQLEANQSIAG